MRQQTEIPQDKMQLGRYHLLKCVGHGGMGEVWLAEDPQLHRQVAIKMLPPQKHYDQEYTALFNREARVVASLNHPHILPVHDYGEQQLADDQVIHYLVMPYINGGSLADLIEQRAAAGEGLHYREALAFLMQAAEAIDYAHNQNLIHRDIKPANMLLRSEGSLLLADFGIALMVARGDDTEEDGTDMVGTPLYIAPEQARGKATAASDLYSLAVIAYQFVTGRPPFQAKTAYATIIQHITQPPPSPRQWHPDLPPTCEEVLLRGLAKQPSDRHASAYEFVVALMHSLGAGDMLTSEPSSDKTRKIIMRRRLLIGTAASMAVLGVTGGTIWALSRLTSSQQTTKNPPELPNPAMILRDLQVPPTSMAWIPGTNILTTSCSDESTIKLWNIDVFRLQNLNEYESTYTRSRVVRAREVAWSQDGKYLAVVASRADFDVEHAYIDIFPADLNSTVASFEQGIQLPSISIRGLGWLESRYLVAVWTQHSDDDHTYLGMWDITQPQLRPSPAIINASPSSLGYDLIYLVLAISPDATHLALACHDRILLGSTTIVGNQVVWLESQHTKVVGQYSGVNGVIWTEDGKRLLGITDAFASLNTVFGWNPMGKTNDLLRFGIPQDATDFTYITAYPKADKAMFAAGTKDGKIYIWNEQTRTLPIRTLISPSIQNKVRMLAWSPDGQWLAASYDDIDATILIWKI